MNGTNIFYILEPPYSDEPHTIYGRSDWEQEFGRASWVHGQVKMETLRCPVYPGHQRAGRRIGNLSIALPSEKISDFVWTWYSDCLITDKVLRVFHDAGLSGFTVSPVEVKPETEDGMNIHNLPVLWELVVTGQGGNAHPQSGIHLICECPHCKMKVYSSFKNGIIVDEHSWDGSDFFTVTGYPNFRLVTERVKDLIVEHGLTNCALVPSQNLVWKVLTRPEDEPNNPCE
ncbi:MAG: hypothetical protein HY741_08500 [Chloroflexi bacterium]|nr:hypothetical protein [Chloroflexota bacterium]